MNHKRTIRYMCLLLLASFLALPAAGLAAEEAPVSKADAQSILTGFAPNVEILSVMPAPVKGLWEIAASVGGKKTVVYIDSEKKYVFIGTIVDASTKRNITQEKFDEINAVPTSEVPLKDSIVIGDPSAPRKLFVFTDPECPFCGQLHPELKKVVGMKKDVAFFIKLYPLVQIHPKAYDKSRAIACETSNEKALGMLEDAYAKKDIPKAACETGVIDDNIKLAGTLGIDGTPAIILDSGRIISGAMKAEDILNLLDRK